jgi:hypothetical protein
VAKAVEEATEQANGQNSTKNRSALLQPWERMRTAPSMRELLTSTAAAAPRYTSHIKRCVRLRASVRAMNSITASWRGERASSLRRLQRQTLGAGSRTGDSNKSLRYRR